MSILTALFVPSGIIFGADRNVTIEYEFDSGAGQTTRQVGQSRRPKVLRWPGRPAVVGYFGLARIGERPMDRWLEDFIGRHLGVGKLDEIANSLAGALQSEVPSSQINVEPLIVHLAGLDDVNGETAPVFWFVHNTAGLTDEGRYLVGGGFKASEELRADLPGRFAGMSAAELRAALEKRQELWDPMWFRQGYDLETFNTLDLLLRSGIRHVVEEHRRQHLERPTTLGGWVQYTKLFILTCGAYFEAYYPPYDQPVGGGADVVTVAWPE